MRRAGISMANRTGAAVLAAALLLSGEAWAQSPGGGLSNLFGNIFSGKPTDNAAADAIRAPRKRRAAALERRGRRLRSPADDRLRDPPSGRELR